MTEHNEICLSINGAQSVRLEKERIKFKIILHKYHFHFKIYADFKCNLESAESYKGSYSKKYQDHIPCSFAYKLVCVDDKFTKGIVVFTGENAAYKFIKNFLRSMNAVKK